MAELVPYPFAALVRRVFRELDEKQSIFDLPASKFVLGDARRDLSVRFHGHEAATPLGPAAGPQSQMAQNIVLSWLGGSRIMELKTVQIMDELELPRPCIDMQTVGFNVEWSQELKLEQSLDEYVKGAMLIRMLVASGKLDLAPGFEHTIYDMSIGYDLAGIRTERVQAFIKGMVDATEVVERFRREIPDEHAQFRDLDYETRLSSTLTLSTFHGCPPDEIEKIIDFLLHENGLNCVVKLNPMLLGPERARELLHGDLGYDDVRIPDSAFERDTRWDQAVAFCERLGDTADSLGLGFGVKFTNTLIVLNQREFFPKSVDEMYLSGAPLHVLAMELVRKFRAHFGDRYPISFSAGIDRKNFPDAVAIGLVPITVCSDLLRPGGYARSKGYFDELASRMDALGATTIDEFVLNAYGLAESTRVESREAWLSAAKIANTEHYVSSLPKNPRYHKDKNSKPPKKIGSHLELFDCITCDKCVPVCPNDANFTFVIPRMSIPIEKLTANGAGFECRADGTLEIAEKHQIANFADFCNECGNCDVFCPEDGGPYVIKPRFFGRLEDFGRFTHLDGFHVTNDVVHARFDGSAYRVELQNGEIGFAGEGFRISLDGDGSPTSARGTSEVEIDLTLLRIVLEVRQAVLADRSSYVGLLATVE